MPENYGCGDVIRRADAIAQQQAHGFVTKDSGERHEFTSGMKRDTSTDKPRYDLVYHPMLKRWAELMGRGAVKYGARNWEKASGQAEFDRFKESAFRHFMQWFMSENPEEDHAAAVFFNISGAEFLKARGIEKDEKHSGDRL